MLILETWPLLHCGMSIQLEDIVLFLGGCNRYTKISENELGGNCLMLILIFVKYISYRGGRIMGRQFNDLLVSKFVSNTVAKDVLVALTLDEMPSESKNHIIASHSNQLQVYLVMSSVSNQNYELCEY